MIASPYEGFARDADFQIPPDTVAFYVDYEEKRSRASNFFRYPSVIGLSYYLLWWAIGAYVVLIISWFALLFTGRYPEPLYGFVARFHRFGAKVAAYAHLLTDRFPSFNGHLEEPEAIHFVIGAPKESYSRWKVLLRLILAIPFYIVATIYAAVALVIAIVDWFVIVLMGEQPKGIQDFQSLLIGYGIRFSAWMSLLTEDWPKFTDSSASQAILEHGYSGPTPWDPSSQASIAAPAEPPAPPAPPAPPEG